MRSSKVMQVNTCSSYCFYSVFSVGVECCIPLFYVRFVVLPLKKWKAGCALYHVYIYLPNCLNGIIIDSCSPLLFTSLTRSWCVLTSWVSVVGKEIMNLAIMKVIQR